MTNQDEELIDCPRCDGSGSIYVNKKTGKERIIGDNFTHDKVLQKIIDRAQEEIQELQK